MAINDGGPWNYVPVFGEAGAPWPGASKLEVYAKAAMEGLLAASYGDEGHVPLLTDADFVPDDNGKWRKKSWGWAVSEGQEKPHRLATTIHQRFVRDAVDYAEAMLAEHERRTAAPMTKEDQIDEALNGRR